MKQLFFGKNRCHIVFVVLFSLLLAAIPQDVFAASSVSTDVVTNHIHENDYSTRDKVSDCYIVNNNDGTFSRVENMGDIIYVEKYTSSLRKFDQRFVTMELPKFGGCYSGANYNFIVFGQDNPENKNDVEVIRIVKYTKDWTRVGAVSFKDINTTYPFYGCNSDFAEYGNKLFFRCGHLNYNGQQELLSLSIRISDCAVKEVQCRSASGNYLDVAATYIDAGDGIVTAADHVLGEPHALRFTNYCSDSIGGGYAYANARVLRGQTGINTPYSNIGGYETTGQYYMMVGSSDPPDGSSPNRNVYVAVVPKYGYCTQNVRISYLTGYAYGDLYSCMVPYLVKVDDDNLVVIWEVKYGYSETEKISYVYLNGSGQMISQVQTMDGCLSDCQPVLVGGQIVWYTTNGVRTTMYSIPARTATVAPTPEARAAIVYNGVDYSAVYDHAFYINKYPDMRVLFANNPAGALEHFVRYGIGEGRQGSENFNVFAYRNYNGDLRNLFGDDLRQYYMHFINSGAAEGRKARW